MKFVLDFITMYAKGMLFLWPILVFLLGMISAMGLRVGALEGWTPTNAIYFAFITATSVGYGDFHPTKRRTKLLAIFIALTGVLLTGLIVAVGLEAVSHAFREARNVAAPIWMSFIKAAYRHRPTRDFGPAGSGSLPAAPGAAPVAAP